MTTLSQILHQATHSLRAAAIETAYIDAQVLLCHTLGVSRSYLFAHSQRTLEPSLASQFLAAVGRRRNLEPVAYIVGYKEFWSLKILVDEHVLVPRPETELLVECGLNAYREMQLTGDKLTLIDAGTGSGAIAVALTHELKNIDNSLSVDKLRCRQWRFIALDASSAALGVAQSNLQQHGLSNDVTLLQSNWLSALAQQSVDLIISNPPYIDGSDRSLSADVLQYEPKQALIAADQGLADIRLLADQAIDVLKPQGRILIEHGWQQAQQVRDILRDCGFKQCKSLQDFSSNFRLSMAVKAS